MSSIYFICDPDAGETYLGSTEADPAAKLDRVRREGRVSASLVLVADMPNSGLRKRTAGRLAESGLKRTDGGWWPLVLTSEQAEALLSDDDPFDKKARRQREHEMRSGAQLVEGYPETDESLYAIFKLRAIARTDEQRAYLDDLQARLLHWSKRRRLPPITSPEEHEAIYGEPPKPGLYED